MTAKAALFITVLLVWQPLYGQPGASFLRLGVNEGLSQNSVREIFQDRQGFIWIGTGDGLNRYDGIQIKKYRQSFRDKSSRRFPGKILNGRIHEDAAGDLWMIVDGKLVKMNVATETFTIIRPIGGDLEHVIIGMEGNHVYVMNAAGVDVVNIADRSVEQIHQPDVIGFYQPTKNESFLLFRKGNSIFRLDPKTKVSRQVLTTGPDSLYAAAVSKSSVLITTGNKVNEYLLPSGKLATSYLVPETLRNKDLSPFLKAPNGDIIATVPGNGIVRVDSIKATFHHYRNIENDPFSLSSNLIYTAIIDHTDNMWLGTEGGGISRLSLRERLFEGFPDVIRTKSESSFMMVKSIYHDEGKIYVGTYGKGLFIIDRETMAHRVTFDPAHRTDAGFGGVFFIRKDDRGRVWMNSGEEIGVADPGKGIFIISAHIPYIRKGKRHNIPQCFAQIGQGRYIVGTVQSTYLVEEKNNQLKLTDLGLVNDQLEGDVQTIFVRHKGDLVIGKGEGEGFIVVRLTKEDEPVIIEKGLQGLAVKYIYRDKLRNAWWYATNLGIIIRKDDGAKEILIDEESGLSNDFIYSIIPEDDHVFWVSTNKGINRILFEKDGSLKVRAIEQYATQHGLQSNEFNTGGYFKDSNLIFFGGVTGINWFDHRKFVKRSFTARSYITDLLINDKPLDVDSAANFLENVRLNYKENNLQIKFATLDYTNPSVNQYLYRLTGYDKTWVRAGSNPDARYSRLPHGNYRFEIISSNSEGVWTAPFSLLSITISPPFWLTWWFRIIAAFTAASLIFFLSRFYLKRKMEKQMRIIEQQLAVNNERLRISRDMHDELGTGLSKIALLSEVGKNDKMPGKNDRIINEISDTSRKLADKMGEIIWTLNPRNDTLSNLAAYLKEYIYETTESLPVEVRFHFPDSLPDLSLGHMIRQQLMLVTKEALNNALKHSGASLIDFYLTIEDESIVFSVKDNGSGFDAGKTDQQVNGKKNGLLNMRSRMASVGGHYALETKEGIGTQVRYGITI
ncbi:histidine kinase [Terrimonas sp. NA20]|uniref:Histidine kinase n=1 Tax=Terrimonas ginsenosidimutans TaxID=2908004 RepID=A0ABS9KSX6_9BACT|nr:two-component regulator propeller domain-containing protein [Terrimonas ginsenosidimutans]MCG2615436.1 histidine kinase [Terrimonas ginsenosidimutans]